MPRKLMFGAGVLVLVLGCNLGQALSPPSTTPIPSAIPPSGPYDIPGTLTALPVTGPCAVMIFSRDVQVMGSPLNGDVILGTVELGATYPVVGKFLPDYGIWNYQIKYGDQLGWVPAEYGDGSQLVAAPQGDCSQIPVVQP